MKTISLALILFLFNLPILQAQINSSSATVEDDAESPSIELVFCLDATGSMSGLIRTAKEKIWDIVSVMSQAEPAPDIKLGLIFYRDLDDNFVTKMYPLTSDIDSLYAELLAIEAQGGGDTPESVNQALNEAVTKMGWSTEKQHHHSSAEMLILENLEILFPSLFLTIAFLVYRQIKILAARQIEFTGVNWSQSQYGRAPPFMQ